MPGFELRLDGVDAMVASVRREATNGDDAGRAVARQMALLAEQRAKLMVTGPPRPPRHGPGPPGLITGALRRSIIVDREGSLPGHRHFVDVAPHTPYGRRLELGFVGTDSIGRHYNQPPYPYMQPTLDWVAANGQTHLIRVWEQKLGL